MKIVSFEDIMNFNIDFKEAYNWVVEMLKNKESAYLPPKISIKPDEKPGVFYNVMPSVLPKENAAGVKLVTRYPDSSPSLNSLLILCDYQNGKPVALMDANFITALRTAAVAVHSIDLFALKDYKTVGLIGLGNVMRATLKVMASVFPDKDLDIKLLKYKDTHISFQEEFRDYEHFHFNVVDSYDAVVSDSDVVISAATYLGKDLCDDSCFKKGVTVIPVHTLGFTNCDLFFDKVFVDDIGHVKHFKYFNYFKSVAEVSDVINGRAEGRTDDSERIIVYNIGISLHDIFYANKIYQKYCSEIKDIEMKTPDAKYWF